MLSIQTLATVSVFAAAFLHAIWNFILKDSSDKAVGIAIIYFTSLPFALAGMFFFGFPSVNALPIILLSGLFQTGYCILLFKGYEAGNLSSVYPIARGSAPLFIYLCSVQFFDVSTTLQAFFGVTIICVGIIYFGWERTKRNNSNSTEILYALGIGAFIAAYSITDAIGTNLIGNAFSFFGAMAIVNRLLLVGYLSLFEEQMMQRIKTSFDLKYVSAGLISFACYAVILWAYTVLPVPVVSSIRETSVVFAALIGVFVLHEDLNFSKGLMIIMVVIGLCLLLTT